MLKINFLPDSDRKDRLNDIQEALKEYVEIWDVEGVKIIQVIKKVSGLDFQESFINSVVYKSSFSPRSFPLSLSAHPSKEQKRCTLIHELCHRLISGNIRVGWKKGESFEFASHKYLDLILYDILSELYGKKVADNNVEYESKSRKSGYSEAWEWALSFDKKKRAARFKKLVNESSKK